MVIDINGNIGAALTLQIREPARGTLKANLDKLSSRSRVKRPLSRLGSLEQVRISPHMRTMRESSRKAGDFLSTMELATLSAGRISYLLKRMHELSISASNGLLNELTRSELNKDFNSLHGEIERIVGTTEFEGKNLLDGSFNAITIKTPSGGTGTNRDNGQIEVKLSDFSIPESISSGIGTKASAMKTIETIKDAINVIDEKSEFFEAEAAVATAALANLNAAGLEPI